ncbi:MAG: hypothetical protein DIU72_002740 [Pseudomonadota bacterium]|nr:MAG: hypothetical protein DIU72_01905 [Pseudomonadota bacterium]
MPNPHGEVPGTGEYRSCSLPTADAGKPCCTSDGCEGRCRPRPGSLPGKPARGTCSSETMPGCWSRYDEGGNYLGDVCI